MTILFKIVKWTIAGFMWAAPFIFWYVLCTWPTHAATNQSVTLPLDCRKSSIQAGVPVRRNSDGKITRIDVCAAADSPVDTFRDIPYEAKCEEFPTGRICY
jgi:hypothetical protein